MQSVDSTNNYARQLIETSRLTDGQLLPEEGAAVFAHEQIMGKGQRGKVWASQKGLNIALSILVNPGFLPITRQFELSACAAVAVHRFFVNYAGKSTCIKWPNDLYWQDRKAGGILIESGVGSRDAGSGYWNWAIIGIGININQTAYADDLPNPVSLQQITGKKYEPLVLAKELQQAFLEEYNNLKTDGFGRIYSAYNEYLYKAGQKVMLKKGNRIFVATVKYVTPAGKLAVNTSSEEEFDFGEVEWILK
ncbi:MAG: biotin--[acetyl-CoA-carboxylase] ligase [Chitinophagaceae bacterium]|nr:biotin--[acetyl-CoA-carboxylase] ligase [Chitinophagaceae bacterium]MBK8952035.1 biotin--[acetyl-CoA-carboxylase] ligase [Chitinophagaceae bacterium]